MCRQHVGIRSHVLREHTRATPFISNLQTKDLSTYGYNLTSMVFDTYPTRPHDAQCGQVIGDKADADIVRKMKGPVRKTVSRQCECERDADHTLKIADNLGLAVCGTHHPEKVSGDW